jgi:hypothetical protein
VSAPHEREILGGYLALLEQRAWILPASRRRELIADIRQHIADARAALDAELDADLLTLLDRLGDPADIVAAAAGRIDGWREPPRAGPLELLALLSMVPCFPVGLVATWFSRCWSLRDKVVATLLSPLLAVGLTALLLGLGLALKEVPAGSAVRGPLGAVVVGLTYLVFAAFVLSMCSISAISYLGFRLWQMRRRPVSLMP